ncbi:MAG: hypothetical protein R2852_09070 [Bacteroidia bacterium]
MRIVHYLSYILRNHKNFSIFVFIVLGLYSIQLVLKVEITPLGYFSLYSNRSEEQNAYYQILPYNRSDSSPLNIYEAPGSGFLMMEILPTRFKILKESQGCNQMSYKLKGLGVEINGNEDCEELRRFNKWFVLYTQRLGFKKNENQGLVEFGFKSGFIKSKTEIR